MKRQEIVTRLSRLRVEIEQEGDVSLVTLETTFALVLSDVCCALGLDGEEHDRVLGRDAAAYVAEIGNTRFWPVGMKTEKETAAVALAELVAVPA